MRQLIPDKGFSLIEVLIAMTIFAISAGGLYGMQLTSAKGNTAANQQTGAVSAGTQFVEQLMRMPFTNAILSPAGNPHDAAADLPALLTSVQRDAPYVNAITWNVTDLGATDSSSSGILRLDLTVRYIRNRQVNLSFLRIRMVR